MKIAKLVTLNCTAVSIFFQVHYPPYLFECFLFAPVHDLESAAEIGNGVAVFKLKKVDTGIWPSLQSVSSGKLFVVHVYRLVSCDASVHSLQ